MTNGDDYRNDCSDPLDFPKIIDNRPGLSTISYRIGTYTDFREYMIRNLNKSDALRAWTHRGSDDPGIALLEAASILGDILTFYQNLYANETFLRTAEWRESVSDLVRLLGYRLSPGVGGKATFALTFKEGDKVVIPAGTVIKADVEGLDEQAVFETSKSTTAYPEIGEFSLYRPIMTEKFSNSVTTFSIPTAKLKYAEMEIDEKDRLMLLDKVDVSTHNSQIVVVKKVETQFEHTNITIEGTWGLGDKKSAVYAFKLGRTFRHFGHNAPAKITKIVNSSQKTYEYPIKYKRNLQKGTKNYSNTTIKPTFKKKQLPLDVEVDDLNVGKKVIIEGITKDEATNVRIIKSIKISSMTWGALTGATTILKLNKKMNDNTNKRTRTDIRDMSIHETVGLKLTLTPPIKIDDTTDNTKLNFYGDADDYELLDRRKVAFLDEENETFKEITLSTEFVPPTTKKQKIMRPVLVSSDLWQEFSLSDFPLEDPTVTVYGNLVDTDQGKTEKEAILGNGDGRQTFQTFKLPKAPLTYHISAGETPPEVPEVQIYVEDRLWKQVPDFYGHEVDEEIYIVREDINGDSWVQFGDGKTGRRLPSGLKNITAKYRSGTGAYGALKENKTPKVASKLTRLDKTYLPDPEGASGGDDPESGENAKEAAPGKIQSLDRLVSLKDFESEALGIAGVSKVLAVWDLVDNVPTVKLTVLMKTGRQTEQADVEETIKKYNRCRGPNRFPIEVETGSLDYVYAVAQVAYDQSYRQELVETAIKDALGMHGEEDDGVDGSKGLFALNQRRFGENEYSSRITGIIQNVEGVLWVKLTGLDSLCFSGTSGASSFFCERIDPSEDISIPTPPILKNTVTCSNQRILSLYKDHLKLTPVSVPAEDC